MTSIYKIISIQVKSYFKEHFDIDLSPDKIVVSETRPEFEGDFTLVVFPFAGIARRKPEIIADEIGSYLTKTCVEIVDFNVVKGFLNLSCSNSYWLSELQRQSSLAQLVPKTETEKIVLEYSSPNANKPLHLGHIRNILLGWSVGQLLKEIGHDVHFTQVVNDRGIAICKSMLAWKKFGKGATPADLGIKSDHFVGNSYVQFNSAFEEEYVNWQTTSAADDVFNSRKNVTLDRPAFFKKYKNDYFNAYSPLGKEAREMLRDWESNDEEVRALWRKMTNWFMDGFKQTAAKLDVHFDSMDFESDTYLLGKGIVQEGLNKNIFYQEEDGSVWIDLTDAKLDKKIVQRGDGTSVYITQDLGTARTRYEKFNMSGMIYTVGNEQNYHFQVLFEIIKRMNEPYAGQLYHLSYGMVDLPSGRMKTREGTVVDADDLIEEVIEKVRENSRGRDELDMLSSQEKENIFQTIGIGALKYYMLRVEAKKKMLFNPEESVELKGQTGPYIQNAFVRIQSLKRRLNDEIGNSYENYKNLEPEEKAVLKAIMAYGQEVTAAAKKYDPSIMASYLYHLARTFHRFYHDHSIVHADSDDEKSFRYHLACITANRLEEGMKLLGISMPDRM